MMENAIKVCEILKKNGFEAYFVGGCVRDKKMRKEAHDIDITTNASPEQIQKIFPRHINTGLQHGTVTVRIEEDFYEVTTYRIDGKYEDGRHPEEVTFVKDVKEDLARRDFTINAIAYDPITNKYVDPFGGLIDIKGKTIKCVGKAIDRFNEDPLRVLRAMRFAIKLGFSIDPDTKEAMHNKKLLKKLSECISKERVTEELRKMLTCGNPVRFIFSEFSDIIGTIIPEMIPCFDAPHNSVWHKHDIYDHILHVVDGCKSNKFEIKLAALLHDIGKPACRTTDEKGDHFKGHPQKSVEIAKEIFEKDLRLSNKETEDILTLIDIHDITLEVRKHYIRKLLIRVGEPLLRDFLILKQSDIDDHRTPRLKIYRGKSLKVKFKDFKELTAIVIEESKTLKVTDLEVKGTDIINEFNIKPGPQIGQILRDLFDAVVEDKVENDKTQLLKFASTLV